MAKSLTQPGSDFNTICSPGKGCREANTAHSRIHITIETEQVVTVGRKDSARVWCQKCGCEVGAADLAYAEATADSAQAAFHGCVELSGVPDESLGRVNHECVSRGATSPRSGVFIRWYAVIRALASKLRLSRMR